jgi:competence protein ComGC
MKTPCPATSANLAGEQSGFTFIELLVVTSTIAILTFMLLAVSIKAELKATSASCAANQKQLAVAWNMYATDNGNRLLCTTGYPKAGPTTATRRPRD